MQETDFMINIGNKVQGVVAQLSEQLEAEGLTVLPSFDFQVARSSHPTCTCSHHGTSQCDCQVIVLLIYHHLKPPVSLMLHGHDGQTLAEIVNGLYQPADPEILSILEKVVYAIGGKSDGGAPSAKAV